MVLLQSAHPLLTLVARGELSPFCFKSHPHCVRYLFLIEKANLCADVSFAYSDSLRF